MRQDTLRRYVDEAGCRAVKTLPTAHDWWRFYRLTA